MGAADEFTTAQGGVRVHEPAPGVFVSELHGHATVGHVAVMVRFAEGMLAGGRRLLVFHDWERVRGYDPDARRRLTEWSERIEPYWDGSHILFASRLVAMAVSVAGLTMRGKLVTYTSRERWSRALAQACATRGIVSGS